MNTNTSPADAGSESLSLEALAQAHAEAVRLSNLERAARQESENFVAAKVKRAASEAEAEAHRLYSSGITAAADAASTAQKRVEGILNARAVAGLDARAQVGLRLREVDGRTHRGRHGRKREQRQGVIEVIHRDSEHSDVIADYSRARINDTVIRVLKADGSPSKEYVKLGHGLTLTGWVDLNGVPVELKPPANLRR